MSFTFTNCQLGECELSMPEDASQIPDLFINVNITTFPEETKSKKDTGKIVNERVGFIRLSYKDILHQKEYLKPKWYVVQSLISRKKTIGRLLVNARLVP